MVMAMGAPGVLSIQEAADSSGDAAALHERLVAYVHAVAGGPETRSGVCVEHSYARARDAASGGEPRELLAPRPPLETDHVDVERIDGEAPPPLRTAAVDDTESESEPEDDWEARVTGSAPGAAHARLAATALDALRRLRLARRAGVERGEAARVEARRFRLALAPLAASTAQPRPAAWLHAALTAHTPRAQRRLYDDIVSQLRRVAPRFAERTLGGRLPPPADDPLATIGPPLGPGAGPWLLWVSVGAERRWARRLAALLHVRELRTPPDAATTPEQWCAATAGTLRGALLDALAEAGPRGAVVGGAGAGGALAAALAAGAGGAGGASGVRGVVTLAPPLVTAEGARRAAAARAPALLVAGTGAAQCWRGAACEAGGGRRVLLVAGADDALRLPAALRRRLRLPQHALDAAVAEEVARWAAEAAEGDAAAAEPAEPSPERPRARRGGEEADDAAHSVAVMTPSNRGIEIIEGRVVTRLSGGTPLALLPPRRERREERPEPRELRADPSAVDIMHLPIVFADDGRALEAPPAAPAPAAPAAPLTVTSGARPQFARVIVAKRPRGRPPATPATPAKLVVRRSPR